MTKTILFSTLESFSGGTNLEDITDLEEPPPDMQRVTFTSAYLDVDGNGYPDRIIGHGGGHLSVYLQNEQGFILYDKYLVGPEGLWMGMALADFDGDFDVDIYATNQGLSPLLLGYDNLPWDGLEEIGENQLKVTCSTLFIPFIY